MTNENHSQAHTPGPWERLQASVWANGQSLCLINTNVKESEANANLIAAASQLKEALEICRNALAMSSAEFAEKYGTATEPGKLINHNEKIVRALIEAEAALKAARGEE